MSDDDGIPTSTGSVRSGSRIAWWMAGFLVLYALSPGPVLKLTTGLSGTTSQTFYLVYAPLTFLYDTVPAVQAFYDWYFKLLGLK